ncbi:hypothetical protein BRADI_3g29627v3 [Brachypodium distachyon]|uniref:Uncharacterized protein n=1 Tax=Brachypodium distachyon TaxID=15368 RepID=A0A2K2D017_BRADI|nr:hypothetical protein BRADI_3g29627v3 [Brachypodium distachyon]
MTQQRDASCGGSHPSCVWPLDASCGGSRRLEAHDNPAGKNPRRGRRRIKKKPAAIFSSSTFTHDTAPATTTPITAISASIRLEPAPAASFPLRSGAPPPPSLAGVHAPPSPNLPLPIPAIPDSLLPSSSSIPTPLPKFMRRRSRRRRRGPRCSAPGVQPPPLLPSHPRHQPAPRCIPSAAAAAAQPSSLPVPSPRSNAVVSSAQPPPLRPNARAVRRPTLPRSCPARLLRCGLGFGIGQGRRKGPRGRRG